jgi:hypothetical protein
MSDLTIAIIFYAVSMIPYFLTIYVKDRTAQWGLWTIDLALTVTSYVYLYKAVGFWWSLMIFVILGGVGTVLRGLGFKPYDNLSDKGRENR